MCDKKRSEAEGEARGDRIEETMPECCGPMFERMKEAFCDATQDRESDPAPETGESKADASCASVMSRMAEACCGAGARGDTAK
jgi:hypothetical protein